MKTIIHLSTHDDQAFDGGLSNIENLVNDAETDMDEIAFIVNGSGVKRLTPNSRFADRLKRCMDHGVAVKACSNSLEEHRIDDAQLLDGVETVSAAVSELSRLQDKGYAYIRP